MAKIFIRLGHSAYNGTSAARSCFSKAQAVRVLRNRGLTRDDARRQINREVNPATSRGLILVNDFSAIECIATVDGMPYGYCMSYEEAKATWVGRSEL